MKKILLLAISIAFTINIYAQPNLPMFQNFDNGLPPGWVAVASDTGSYNFEVNGNCMLNKGLVTGPSIGSSGNNKTGFETDTLRYANPNSFVTVRFEGYLYQGNRLRCEDRLVDSTPCTALGKVYLLDVNGHDTIGTGSEFNLNLTTGVNTIFSRIFSNVAVNTEFKVLVDISHVTCDNIHGSMRFVMDNVLITVTEGGPLAVFFRSFRATRSSHQNVLVNWTTASEQNSRGFYVQRNTNGTWENVTYVPSRAINGNSSTDLSYSFTDMNSNKGISQYRIRQVDLNGAERLSDVSIVRGEPGKMVVFPNPSFDGNATVLFDDQKTSRDIMIFDMAGRAVKQWTGVTNNSMHMEDLRPGFYTIRVVDRSTGEQVVQKFIVNKR